MKVNAFGFTLIELLIVIAVLGVLSVGVLTAINVTGNINKANLAKAKTFSASVENALSINQVGKWSFESIDPITNKTPDTSGYGNDGTVNGATLKNASDCGLGFGGCLSFDGGSNYVDVADNEFWNFGNNDFLIGMWAKFNSITGNMDLIGQSNGGGRQDKWMIGYNFPSTNKISFHMHGSTIKDIIANWTASTDRWHYIVFTRGSNTWKFYIDGVSISSETYTGTVPNSTSTLKIGVDGELWKYFPGLIDEVAIYNQALTASQIQQLYAQGLPRHQLALRY